MSSGRESTATVMRMVFEAAGWLAVATGSCGLREGPMLESVADSGGVNVKVSVSRVRRGGADMLNWIGKG